MSDLSLRVTGLGKRYRIGARQEAYLTLREKITETALLPFRRAAKLWNPALRREEEKAHSIWALKDISLQIGRGEVVGVIGRNGAGKSTLLKILSRITEPTRGRVEIWGRVGSLLEVGTGFHPELTGRENIYLNGAILGMTRVEIERKFDAIVAFAEVEKFIDTPVKRYSSGMYLRLAFAVAAHLDPDILLVDEVLAVGDASFQKKCLSQMETVGRQGRTVIFVSHNMQAITRLCDRAIMLEQGRIVEDGPSHRTVSTYLNSGMGTTASREWPDPRVAPQSDVVALQAVRVLSQEGEVEDAVDIRDSFQLQIQFQVRKPGMVLVPSFQFYNEEGIHLFTSFDLDPEWRRRPRPAGCYASTVTVPGNLLAEGLITVAAVVNTFDPSIVHFREPDAVAFHIVDTMDGNSARGDHAGRMRGVMRPLLKWRNRYYGDGVRVAGELAQREGGRLE